MNIQSIKKQIQKIDALCNVIENDQGISNIERDLLKSYVQQLYEMITEEKNMDPVQSLPAAQMESSRVPIIAKHVESIQQKKSRLEEYAVEESTIDADIQSFLKDPIDEIQFTQNSMHRNGQANGQSQTTFDAPDLPQHTELKPETTVSVMDLPEIDEAITTLFQEAKTGDLSDKLRNAPLSDIQKGFGLNDRILVINELFAGNGEDFKMAVTHLNELTSFAEAKKYLINKWIGTHNWTAEGKIKSATTFINVIRRKYI